jgi:uncharacterized protein
METDVKGLRSNRLKRFLQDEEEILALYLFGSHSQGLAHIRSDVDLALLLAPEVDAGCFFKYRLRYVAELKRFFVGELDLIILNQVPPLLEFQVLKNGQLLFDRNPNVRAKLEMRMLNRYYLSKRSYEYHFEHLIQRIKEEGLGHGSRSDSSALEKVRRISQKFNAL